MARICYVIRHRSSEICFQAVCGSNRRGFSMADGHTMKKNPQLHIWQHFEADANITSNSTMCPLTLICSLFLVGWGLPFRVYFHWIDDKKKTKLSIFTSGAFAKTTMRMKKIKEKSCSIFFSGRFYTFLTPSNAITWMVIFVYLPITRSEYGKSLIFHKMMIVLRWTGENVIVKHASCRRFHCIIRIYDNFIFCKSLKEITTRLLTKWIGNWDSNLCNSFFSELVREYFKLWESVTKVIT